MGNAGSSNLHSSIQQQGKRYRRSWKNQPVGQEHGELVAACVLTRRPCSLMWEQKPDLGSMPDLG